MSIPTFLKSLSPTPAHLRSNLRRGASAVRLRLDTLEDRSVPAGGISFAEPIDFATGATPGVTAAFNAAFGDQIALDIAMDGGVPRLADGVAVGDFNYDTHSDVAQTNVIAGSVSVFLGDGLGGFATANTYPVGVNPISVVAGDLNGDSHLDLVVANFGSNNVTILHGNGDGTFLPASFVPLETGVGPRNVVIGAFNGDGIPDLAVAQSGLSGSQAGGVAILNGQANGSFTQAFISLSPGANYVAAGDFNGDGLDDLAVGVGVSSNAGDRQAGDTKLTGDDVLIFLNGSGTFGTVLERIRVGATPRGIAVADMNGDHHLDLAVMDGASATVTVLMGDGQGHFASKQPVTSGTAGASLAVGYFNDDTIPDLVTANFFSSTVSVLEGIGDGTFQPAVEFWAGNAPTSVATGDFNGDGRVDVIAGRLRTDQLSLLLNNPPRPGDGLKITRDIYYLPTDPATDLLAAHHKLDVYSPPQGTASFAGIGQPYPVLFFTSGGKNNTTGDKSAVSYLMRSLAQQGIVGVSIEFRLGTGLGNAQIQDTAHAFRWVYENVKSYGGDPHNIFVFGHSSAAFTVGRLSTESRWVGAHGLSLSDIRGAVLVSGHSNSWTLDPNSYGGHPPSLLLSGTEGAEVASPGTTAVASPLFRAASIAAGAEAQWEIIQGRDHFTLMANMARPSDAARVFILNFMQRNLIPNPTSDLQVTNIVAANTRGAQGDKVTITATITNSGTANAGPSQTEFLLDGATVIGLVNTPAIPAGGSETVSVQWNTAGVKGQHVITVTADRTGVVGESDETNNIATLTVTIKGNKVKNGSFEQANADGSGPAGWTGTSTAAGTASWNAEAGSVSFAGTGGSTLFSGSPSWTSDPIAVTAGEQLLLMASVSSIGASSGATVSLAYFNAAGQLLGTVPVLSIPLTTNGPVTLQQQITTPLGAASVRIVLTGFAASDPATAGVVTFDTVGLYDFSPSNAGLLSFLYDDLLWS